MRKIWRRKWQLTPIFLPKNTPWTEEPDGLQSKVSDLTEHTHWVFATLILYRKSCFLKLISDLHFCCHYHLYSWELYIAFLSVIWHINWSDFLNTSYLFIYVIIFNSVWFCCHSYCDYSYWCFSICCFMSSFFSFLSQLFFKLTYFNWRLVTL